MSEVRFSEAARKFPVLNDKAHTDFKGKIKKRIAWCDVAKELGFGFGMF